MRPEEVIDYLKNEKLCIIVADSNKYTRKCANCELVVKTEVLLDVYDTAIEALEKQIPMKPDISWEGYVDGYELFREHCANCGYIFDNNIIVCCPNCGQVVDWSDGE